MKIIAKDSKGIEHILDGNDGWTVMEALRDAGLPITAECGGACACATCHVYVDAAADPERAHAIVMNAKTQRTSVCNAAESLVVHAAVADTFVPRVADVLAERGVELVGDAEGGLLFAPHDARSLAAALRRGAAPAPMTTPRRARVAVRPCESCDSQSTAKTGRLVLPW